MPVRSGAMVRLSELLRKIDQHRLPVHVTPVARLMFKTMASSLGGLNGLILRQLTSPILTDSVLNLLGERGRLFSPLLHNTVSATILHGSEKINVIPSVASVEIDGRLLPGYQPDDMIHELRQIIGEDVELEVVRHDPGPSEPDMGLFDTLADILGEVDPGGVPIPLQLSGVTDGRFFSRLGIQTYGFLPMRHTAFCQCCCRKTSISCKRSIRLMNVFQSTRSVLAQTQFIKPCNVSEHERFRKTILLQRQRHLTAVVADSAAP
jgi:acetylornithine deacetylase/succinyl-diaminopimelate desuccinylase-like protein